VRGGSIPQRAVICLHEAHHLVTPVAEMAADLAVGKGVCALLPAVLTTEGWCWPGTTELSGPVVMADVNEAIP
jgi:hypothetical protein